jgi:hypothetical protein
MAKWRAPFWGCRERPRSGPCTARSPPIGTRNNFGEAMSGTRSMLSTAALAQGNAPYNPTEIWRRARIETRRAISTGPAMGSGWNHVEPMPTIAAFDLDQPEIGIVSQFAGEARLGDRRLDPVGFMSTQPSALAIERVVRRAGRKNSDSSIESIHQDVNRAGLRGAAPPEHRVGAFHRDATQIGGDPDVGA